VGSAHHHPSVRLASNPAIASNAMAAPTPLRVPSPRSARLPTMVPARRFARASGGSTTRDAAATRIGATAPAAPVPDVRRRTASTARNNATIVRHAPTVRRATPSACSARCDCFRSCVKRQISTRDPAMSPRSHLTPAGLVASSLRSTKRVTTAIVPTPRRPPPRVRDARRWSPRLHAPARGTRPPTVGRAPDQRRWRSRDTPARRDPDAPARNRHRRTP
jgi:hypothetical protein